jgi:hypothetical protein
MVREKAPAVTLALSGVTVEIPPAGFRYEAGCPPEICGAKYIHPVAGEPPSVKSVALTVTVLCAAALAAKALMSKTTNMA